jgi:multiple sugar transport system ATP-binding protein
MDEPLSNLDAKLRNQMRAEIIKLRQRIKSTFIYVTHDQTEAMTLGDRIVIMKDGVIQQIGTPQEVYDDPVNMFVAGFIGVPQMNFYDGKLLRSADGKYSVQVEDAVIELSAEKQKNLADRNVAAQDVTVGVRPDHISLKEVPGKMIHGKVDVSELMGSAVHLHINACGKDGVIIVPTLDLKGNKTYSMGSDISFTFDGGVAHVFAKDSQKNLEFGEAE